MKLQPKIRRTEIKIHFEVDCFRMENRCKVASYRVDMLLQKRGRFIFGNKFLIGRYNDDQGENEGGGGGLVWRRRSRRRRWRGGGKGYLLDRPAHPLI